VQVNKTAEDEEEAQIEIAKALSVLDLIPDGKPPALPREEYEKQKQLAQEQESLENELKEQVKQQMEEKLRQVDQEFSPQGTLTPPKEAEEEEEVPGTPDQVKNLIIVTHPKRALQDAG
jgi:hypothetical protein